MRLSQSIVSHVRSIGIEVVPFIVAVRVFGFCGFAVVGRCTEGAGAVCCMQAMQVRPICWKNMYRRLPISGADSYPFNFDV